MDKENEINTDRIDLKNMLNMLIAIDSKINAMRKDMAVIKNLLKARDDDGK